MDVGLLTGEIGCGKTTVAGRKMGIWAVDVWGGRRRLLAHTERELGGPQLGGYSFDAAALDWLVSVIEEAIHCCDLVVVDEIGKLELWDGAGLAPILPRLAAGPERGQRCLVLVRSSLLSVLQARLGAVALTVFQVDGTNRDTMPATIAAWLGLAPPGEG